MNAYDIIIEPVVSEKSMDQMKDRKYSFKVATCANKIQIKDALEEVFGVTVAEVTTMNVIGKVKRVGAKTGKRPDWKKAIVKLTPDSKTIEFFDGMA